MLNKTAIELIQEECERVRENEKFSEVHDDSHTEGELSRAAASYSLYTGLHIWKAPIVRGVILDDCAWPFENDWFKPSDDPIRNLVKAGQFIVAEIERLQRLEKKST